MRRYRRSGVVASSEALREQLEQAVLSLRVSAAAGR